MIAIALALAMQANLSDVIRRRKDPITDVESISAVWGNESAGVALTCVPSKQRLVVIFIPVRHRFGKSGLINSSWTDTYRFDSAKPVSTDWWHDDDTSNLEDTGSVVAFIQGLVGAKQIVFRARDFYREQFDEVISLHDTKEAAREVVQACGDTKVRQRLGAILD